MPNLMADFEAANAKLNMILQLIAQGMGPLSDQMVLHTSKIDQLDDDANPGAAASREAAVFEAVQDITMYEVFINPFIDGLSSAATPFMNSAGQIADSAGSSAQSNTPAAAGVRDALFSILENTHAALAGTREFRDSTIALTATNISPDISIAGSKQSENLTFLIEELEKIQAFCSEKLSS